MRIKTLVTTAAAALALTAGLSACSSPSSESSAPAVSHSAEATAPAVSLSGTFGGLNDKKVAGTAKIDGDTLTLSGFSSDEGPDLHLYLTNGTDEAAVTAGTTLGAVKFDAASQTFKLDGIKAGDFTYVVVHCDKALAVFGAAPLA
ncbi:hypothetical protein D9V32_09330 [Mycetocola tolaasinivorans]|uniref:DM13 domain-containing protein n=1 Tax=Mycetocola tolaasinivorans TaxID=76635 RepID=A0A3L7A8G8_9MICO|nr:DM13 domain-containing protein [Mycetocola tolaasinivorans]RLP75662.1 hypothetical protein D9V32_09330 [Mycetocola tolaasinivorans]